MISLQKLLGKDDKFFNLLEASAEEGRASAHALRRLLEKPINPSSLEELSQSRRKDKAIRQEITEQILKTFVTTLEREDIEQLSNALYKVPKTIEKFAERFLICAPHLGKTDFKRQVALLEKATDEMLSMVKQLRQGAHLEKIKEENVKLQKLEGEADKLILDLLRDLYSGKHTDIEVIALKELYEILEKVIDRCRDAGNVVTHIVLKHS
ncbi:MAG: DUF47 family protein [Verrucomicrobia bacterium]|nr:DUF47 family protein [Verrucomicrobiota bacterium]